MGNANCFMANRWANLPAASPKRCARMESGFETTMGDVAEHGDEQVYTVKVQLGRRFGCSIAMTSEKETPTQVTVKVVRTSSKLDELAYLLSAGVGIAVMVALLIYVVFIEGMTDFSDIEVYPDVITALLIVGAGGATVGYTVGWLIARVAMRAGAHPFTEATTLRLEAAVEQVLA